MPTKSHPKSATNSSAPSCAHKSPPPKHAAALPAAQIKSHPNQRSTCGFSVCIDTEGSHVPCNRLAQDQATDMPDTVPPVIRFRRNWSRSLLTNHGFDIVLTLFDMRS